VGRVWKTEKMGGSSVDKQPKQKVKVKKTKKRKARRKTLTPNEMKALELVSKDPKKSNSTISKEMNELGMVRDPNYLTRRLSTNAMIAEKISKLRENAELKILESSPKAVKVVNKEMESKSGKQRLDAAKTVLRHSIPSQDERGRSTPTFVSIETLQQIQNINLIGCQERLDAIEAEEVSEGQEDG